METVIEYITQFIQSVGFPIAACCFLFYQNAKQGETLKEFSSIIESVKDTLSENTSTLQSICGKLLGGDSDAK